MGELLRVTHTYTLRRRDVGIEGHAVETPNGPPQGAVFIYIGQPLYVVGEQPPPLPLIFVSLSKENSFFCLCVFVFLFFGGDRLPEGHPRMKGEQRSG